MTREKRTPKIELGAVIITLLEREIFRDRGGAEELAKAIGTTVVKYSDRTENRIVQAELKNPPMTFITVNKHGDQRPGSTEFIVYVDDRNGSLKRELEVAAGLIDQATRLDPEGPAENRSDRESLLKVVHLMNTDEIPNGYPKEEQENPVAWQFITPSGNRCLSTMTWKRDHEIEKIDMENDEHQGPQYAFRIESMTRVPAIPGRQALTEIMMAAYNMGVGFLLG